MGRNKRTSRSRVEVIKKLLYTKKPEKSVFFSWFYSYIFILIIPIVLCGVIYFISYSAFEKEAINSTEAMIRQVQLNMDNIFEDAERLALQVILNPKIDHLAMVETELTFDERYSIIEIINELKRANPANGYLGDLYIYFKKPNLVLTTLSCMDPFRTYDAMKMEDYISFEDWLSAINKNYSSSCLLLLNTKKLKEEPLTNLLYVRSLPLIMPNEDAFTQNVIININPIRLDAMIKSNMEDSGASLFIINKEDNVLVSTEDIIPEFLKYDTIDNVFRTKCDNEDVMVFSSESSYTELKYVSIIAEKSIKEKNEGIKYLMYLSILLCIMIGGVISYIITKRNYSPLNELIQFSANYKKHTQPANNYNEYSYIRNFIKSSQDENKEISERLRRQGGVYFSSLLVGLLMGKKNLPEDIRGLLHQHFNKNGFVVMLIQSDDAWHIFSSISEINASLQLPTSSFIFWNVFEEMLENKIHASTQFVEVEDAIALIINIDVSPETQSESIAEIKTIALEASHFINKNFGMSLVAAISNINHGIESLPNAYKESQKALQYKIILGLDAVILYNDIKSCNQSYEYSIETEQKLINAIKLTDIETAREIVSGIFSSNFREAMLSVYMTKCLLMDLIGTIIKTVQEVKALELDYANEIRENLESLLDKKTIIDMQEYMLELLEDICDKVRKTRSERPTNLVKNVEDYVLGNYFDITLNVNMVADYFRLSSTYVSKIYKEQRTKSLPDFINGVRINAAKALLSEGKLSINEIAAKTGFANTNTFIRAFKKYEGITPGQYKELNLNKQFYK